MEYKGYKLLPKITLVCQQPRINTDKNTLWAYLVDPNNKRQLQSARAWATYTEYVDQHTTIEHEPDEFTFDNDDFQFTLKDCAGHSSQGGKLSFWNCIVSKNGFNFIIGINSQMLLDVLKEGTFKCGVCQETVCFTTRNGQCGVVVKNSPSYLLAVEDMNIKSKMNSSLTTKYKFGDNVVTTTIDQIYVGKFYRYYKVECTTGYRYASYLKNLKIIKLAKPEVVHLYYDGLYRKEHNNISDILDGEYYHYQSSSNIIRRSIGDKKLELDLSEDEFKNTLIKKKVGCLYDFNIDTETGKNHILLALLQSKFFGLNTQPFELRKSLIEQLRRMGVTFEDEIN